jgi:hypothetical protein
MLCAGPVKFIEAVDLQRLTGNMPVNFKGAKSLLRLHFFNFFWSLPEREIAHNQKATAD